MPLALHSQCCQCSFGRLGKYLMDNGYACHGRASGRFVSSTTYAFAAFVFGQLPPRRSDATLMWIAYSTGALDRLFGRKRAHLSARSLAPLARGCSPCSSAAAVSQLSLRSRSHSASCSTQWLTTQGATPSSLVQHGRARAADAHLPLPVAAHGCRRALAHCSELRGPSSFQNPLCVALLERFWATDGMSKVCPAARSLTRPMASFPRSAHSRSCVSSTNLLPTIPLLSSSQSRPR